MSKSRYVGYDPAVYKRNISKRADSFVISRDFERLGLDKERIKQAAAQLGSNKNQFVSAALFLAVNNPKAIKEILVGMED